MAYYTRADKQTKYLNNLNLLLQKHYSDGQVPAKMAASVLGKIQSLKKSHGNIVSILPRNTYNELGHTVIRNNDDWDCDVTFVEGLPELEFLLKNLHLYNGKAISNSKQGGQTITQSEVAKIVHNVLHTNKPVDNLLISDASDRQVFTFYHGDVIELNNYEFSVDEQKFSSGRRELIGLVSFLQYSKSIDRKFKYPLLYWETDSQISYYYLVHGSRKTLIQNIILQVKSLEIELGITVIPLWTSRAHFRIKLADDGSRLSTNTDKWGVPKFLLNSVFTYFSHFPDIDAFADKQSAICKQYISEFLDSDNFAINFFSHSPQSGKCYFLCPPTSLIGPTIRFIEDNSGPIYILLVPMWTSSPWWTLLHTGQNYHVLVKAIHIFVAKPILYHSLNIDSIFSKSMKFIALLMKH